jgi:hypothetical protein
MMQPGKTTAHCGKKLLCMNLKVPFKLPFWASSAVLVVVLVWMFLNCSAPLEWVVTGDIFSRHFAYVDSPYTTAGDSFRVGVNKMVLAALLLFSVLALTLGVLRWLSAELSRIEARVLFVLSAILGLFPISAFTAALVMVSRLTLDMGITPRRLQGVACAIGGILVVLSFLRMVLPFKHKLSSARL